MIGLNEHNIELVSILADGIWRENGRCLSIKSPLCPRPYSCFLAPLFVKFTFFFFYHQTSFPPLWFSSTWKGSDPWLLLTLGCCTCPQFCLSAWCLYFCFALILIYICTQFLTTCKFAMMVKWLNYELAWVQNMILANWHTLDKLL